MIHSEQLLHMITGKVLLTLYRLLDNSFAPKAHFRLKRKERKNTFITRDTTQTRSLLRIEEKVDVKSVQRYAGAKTYVIFCCKISPYLSYAPTTLNCLKRFIHKHKIFIYLSFFGLHRSYFVAAHTPRSLSPSPPSLFLSKSLSENKVRKNPNFHVFPVL